jgi:hypothetical protein
MPSGTRAGRLSAAVARSCLGRPVAAQGIHCGDQRLEKRS